MNNKQASKLKGLIQKNGVNYIEYAVLFECENDSYLDLFLEFALPVKHSQKHPLLKLVSTLPSSFCIHPFRLDLISDDFNYDWKAYGFDLIFIRKKEAIVWEDYAPQIITPSMNDETPILKSFLIETAIKRPTKRDFFDIFEAKDVGVAFAGKAFSLLNEIFPNTISRNIFFNLWKNISEIRDIAYKINNPEKPQIISKLNKSWEHIRDHNWKSRGMIQISDKINPAFDFFHEQLVRFSKPIVHLNGISRCPVCGDFVLFTPSQKRCSLKRQGKDCAKRNYNFNDYLRHQNKRRISSKDSMREHRAYLKSYNVKK